MEFLKFVMALSPIIVVLVGILGFRQSAKKVTPVALIWTLVLAFTYFNITGASLGNLICPNNTVAACATVDQIGNENKVMKRTLPAFAIILAVYMVLTMLYTCMLFPHFGM